MLFEQNMSEILFTDKSNQSIDGKGNRHDKEEYLCCVNEWMR